MMDECGYCGGETDTGMNCIAGCQNVRPARIVYGINRCTCHWHPGRKCNACKREALLEEIDALQKGEA